MSDPIVLPDPPSGLPGLSEDDLAYMRKVQAQHRPTHAILQARSETPDGMGGTTTDESGPEVPVGIRVSQADKVPDVLAERYGVGVVDVTMDLVTVRVGDRLTVSATEAYEVVSDGAIGQWTTAQKVLAVRVTWPPAGA